MTLAVTNRVLCQSDNSQEEGEDGWHRDTMLHKRYFKSNAFNLLIWASLSGSGIQVQDAKPNTNNYRAACFDEDKLVWMAIYNLISLHYRKSLLPFGSHHTDFQTHLEPLERLIGHNITISFLKQFCSLLFHWYQHNKPQDWKLGRQIHCNMWKLERD